jgi:hypothetical protein
MMFKLFGAGSVLVALLMVMGGADGQDGKKKGRKGGGFFKNPEETFKKLDTNSDGKLTKAEFLKIADKITDAEKAAKVQGFLGKAFDKMATDGSVTLDQFKEAAAKFGKGKGRKKKSADTE